MATKAKATESQDVKDFNDLREKMAGHSSIEIEYDEEKYILKFPRELVKQMEQDGITADSIMDMASATTLTAQEEFIKNFVMKAFVTEQPDIELDKVIEIYEGLGGKQELLSYLVILFMQPILALTTDPTKTRAKFRLV